MFRRRLKRSFVDSTYVDVDVHGMDGWMREIRSGVEVTLDAKSVIFVIYWLMWWFIGRILGLV
jgi:hypothetical protein